MIKGNISLTSQLNAYEKTLLIYINQEDKPID
jgi:hypothetical protein